MEKVHKMLQSRGSQRPKTEKNLTTCWTWQGKLDPGISLWSKAQFMMEEILQDTQNWLCSSLNGEDKNSKRHFTKEKAMLARSYQQCCDKWSAFKTTTKQGLVKENNKRTNKTNVARQVGKCASWPDNGFSEQIGRLGSEGSGRGGEGSEQKHTTQTRGRKEAKIRKADAWSEASDGMQQV